MVQTTNTNNERRERNSNFIKPELLLHKSNQNIMRGKTVIFSRNVENYFTKFNTQKTRNKGKFLLPDEGQYEKSAAVTMLIVSIRCCT